MTALDDERQIEGTEPTLRPGEGATGPDDDQLVGLLKSTIWERVHDVGAPQRHFVISTMPGRGKSYGSLILCLNELSGTVCFGVGLEVDDEPGADAAHQP